jgi:hypothetical protein
VLGESSFGGAGGIGIRFVVIKWVKKFGSEIRSETGKNNQLPVINYCKNKNYWC